MAHTSQRRDGKNRRARLLLCAVCPVLGALLTSPRRAEAEQKFWIGGNTVWSDGAANNGNWVPFGEPGPLDEAIFNLPNSVHMGSDNTVLALTLNSGSPQFTELFTDDHRLEVNGLVQVAGSGFNINSVKLHVNGSNSLLSADGLVVTANEDVNLAGGTIRIAKPSGFGQFILDGILQGYGVINMDDSVSGATALFINQGGIQTDGGLLSINAADADARLDLDGGSDDPRFAAWVLVLESATLEINVPLWDAFNGDILLSGNGGAQLRISHSWTLGAGGTIDSGHLTDEIAGGLLTQLGGTILVNDEFAGLHLSAPYFLISGDFLNNGLLTISNDAHIFSGANFIMAGNRSSITVEAAGHLIVDQPEFDADGNGTDTNVITLEGIMELNLGAAADRSFSGKINMRGGTLQVNTVTWSINGPLNVDTNATSRLRGQQLTINNTAVNISNSAVLLVEAPLVFGGSATYFGNGTLMIANSSTVAANTTIEVGLFSWDGGAGAKTHTINSGVTMKINSPMSAIEDDTIVIGGNGGSLVVQVFPWEMRGTLTANPSNAGTAFIGGTARLILGGSSSGVFNVAGDTNVDAPITFDSLSTTSIPAAGVLNLQGDTIYNGGAISGAGILNPSSALNHVSANSSISTATMNFDRGDWIINPNATLTVNVTDYDFGSINRFNGSAITINSGALNINTGDPGFVMDGTLNLSNTTGTMASWAGEPLDSGNDDSSERAHLNVGGSGISQITAPVNFYSDVDVNVAAGATLNLTNTVNFRTVNGSANATFTGAGTLSFSGPVNVTEGVTLNMPGGTVDLDGTDSAGDIININAPLVLNAAIVAPFGRDTAVPVNSLAINHSSTATGSLTVNLDSPASEWTLNAKGVMNLNNAEVAPAVLLAGSPVNLNGTVQVQGNVLTTARVDIGGTVTIQLPGFVFRLQGGSATVFNGLAGGTINGPGTLATDTLHGLSGFGTINANIDFDGDSALVAQGGVLDVNGTIADVGILRTFGNPAVLDLALPLSTAVSDNGISMEAGTLSGATLTIASTTALLQGRGTVNNPLINNGEVHANGGLLVLAGSTTINAGSLMSAATGSILRLTGSISATGEFTKIGGGTLGFNGPQNHAPGAKLNVTAGAANLNSSAGTVATHNLSINVSGGQLSMNATQHLKALELSGSGLATLSTGFGPLVMRTDSLAITGSGKLDLANNRMIVVGGNVANILALVRSGYNGGAWNGMGIITSMSTGTTAIGVARADEVGLNPGTFGGIGVQGSDVLAMYTLKGDLNLDGSVTIADFIDLAARFNTLSNATWRMGDVNYDQKVTIADFIDLASNFNQSVSGDAMPVSVEDLAMLNSFAASVPEPCAAMITVLCWFNFAGRRRRK